MSLGGVYLGPPRGPCCGWCRVAEPHELTLVGPMVYPGGQNGMFKVRCSCGYATSPHATPKRAEGPAREHRDAKRRARTLAGLPD